MFFGSAARSQPQICVDLQNAASSRGDAGLREQDRTIAAADLCWSAEFAAADLCCPTERCYRSRDDPAAAAVFVRSRQTAQNKAT